MKKVARLSFLHSFFIFIIFAIFLCSVKSDIIHDINQNVPGTSDYKTVSFESEESQKDHFFKYTVTTIPKSRIGALRFDFNRFNPESLSNQVLCTFVEQQTSDADLEEALRGLSLKDSACIGKFDSEGKYNGIVEYDTSKKKIRDLFSSWRLY